MAAAEKKAGKKGVQFEDVPLPFEEELTGTQMDGVLHVVEEPKPEPKPGDPDFDWQAEYPDEQVWVYTVPETAKKSPTGKQSPPGLTIGMARLTEDRAPNPGEMEEAYEIGGFKPMWLFLSCVSSPDAKKLQKLLRPTEYNAMLRGWAKFAGIELSE